MAVRNTSRQCFVSADHTAFECLTPVFQPIQEQGLIIPFITDMGTADSVTETGLYEIYTQKKKKWNASRFVQEKADSGRRKEKEDHV